MSHNNFVRQANGKRERERESTPIHILYSFIHIHSIWSYLIDEFRSYCINKLLIFHSPKQRQKNVSNGKNFFWNLDSLEKVKLARLCWIMVKDQPFNCDSRERTTEKNFFLKNRIENTHTLSAHTLSVNYKKSSRTCREKKIQFDK